MAPKICTPSKMMPFRISSELLELLFDLTSLRIILNVELKIELSVTETRAKSLVEKAGGCSQQELVPTDDSVGADQLQVEEGGRVVGAGH